MNTQTKHAESGCTDYLQHTWESCPENKSAPNKAQHSPEWKFKTWPNGEIALCRYEGGQYVGEYLGPYTAETLRDIVLKSNHSGKLSEALRDLTRRVDDLEGQEIEYSLGVALAKSCMKAKSHLAAYDEAAQ